MPGSNLPVYLVALYNSGKIEEYKIETSIKLDEVSKCLDIMSSVIEWKSSPKKDLGQTKERLKRLYESHNSQPVQ